MASIGLRPSTLYQCIDLHVNSSRSLATKLGHTDLLSHKSNTVYGYQLRPALKFGYHKHQAVEIPSMDACGHRQQNQVTVTYFHRKGL